MFYDSYPIVKSSLLDEFEKYGVRHGFSTRHGGVSTNEHTKSLNITYNLGDDDATVKKNLGLLAHYITPDADGACTVTVHQIHSNKVRVITPDNRGEGYSVPRGENCDGFAAKEPNIMPIVKTADCTPILFCALDCDENPIIAAVHAGWRGTASGIAAEAVSKMLSLGAVLKSVTAAIGPHISVCCYEVGEDFSREIEKLRGEDFAKRHIIREAGKNLHADLTSMNVEILLSAGVAQDRIDISSDCTSCDTAKYFSHRKMNGRRGTMGSGIVIVR